jgi:GT2 family glycosyltransferase
MTIMKNLDKIKRYFTGLLFNFSSIILYKRLSRKIKGLFRSLSGGLMKNNHFSYDTGKVCLIIIADSDSEQLKKTLDFAIGQTYSDFEIIIISDKSDIHIRTAIIEHYAHVLGIKQIDFNKEDGRHTILNQTIINSSGDWITILYAGEWLEPDAIEKWMAALKSLDGVLFGFTDNSDNDNYHLTNNPDTTATFQKLFIRDPGSFATLINKKVFLKTGLFEQRFDGLVDYDIALKAAFHFPDTYFVQLQHEMFHLASEIEHIKSRGEKLPEKLANIREEASLRMAFRNGQHDQMVSFIIMSFEKKEMTLQCIQTIKSKVKIPHEIILYDNGSLPETRKFIQTNIEIIPDVIVIYAKENSGLGKSRHEAFKKTTGDYIVNVDNDIFIGDHWIEELIIKARSDDNIMAVTGKTVFPDGKLQFNGGKFVMHDGFIKFSLIDFGLPENDIHSALWNTCDWVPGGTTLFKRELLNKIDFSSGYINAFEDLDMAFQIYRMGYKVANCPSAKAVHNHIYFTDKRSKRENRYIKARYNNDGLIRSYLNFYRRYHLILEDTYIFTLFSLNGKSNEKKRAFVNQLVKKYHM